MEQILGLVFAILISVGASWLEKRWNAHKRNIRRNQYRTSEPEEYRPQPVPMITPRAIMSPENEGGRVTPPQPQQADTPIISADDSEESAQRLARWRQAIIDSEILAPRHF